MNAFDRDDFATLGHIPSPEDVDSIWKVCGKLSRRPDRILEVGSFAGASATIFLEACQPELLYCVDPWLGAYDERDGVCKLYRLYGSAFVYETFCRNMGKALGTRICPLRMTSKVASTLSCTDSLSLVFIDGDHGYETVKEDIRLWEKRINPGGVLCGHDYRVFNGVTKAVDECGLDGSFGSVWYRII